MSAFRSRLDSMLDRIEAVPSPSDLSAAETHRLDALKDWQLRRLYAHYADLKATPRYSKATDFFVRELYGPGDRSVRYRSVRRIVPMMDRVLPNQALETLALALELQAVSDELDLSLARALDDLGVDPLNMDHGDYAEAYRVQAAFDLRHEQLEMLETTGRRLDHVVRLPLVLLALRLARGPAELAGLGELHGFLERGCRAFGAMSGADEFLETIIGRERDALAHIRAGGRAPFGDGFDLPVVPRIGTLG